MFCTRTRLRQDIKCIGIGAQFVAKQIFRVRILLLQLGLVDLLGKVAQKLLFLGSHELPSGGAYLVEWSRLPD